MGTCPSCRSRRRPGPVADRNGARARIWPGAALPALLLLPLLALAQDRPPGEQPPQDRSAESPLDLYGESLPPGAIARLGNRRPKEPTAPFSVAFSPDLAIVATTDGTDIRLWDVATCKVTRTLQREGHPFWSLAFSSDGKRLASGDSHGEILLWDLGAGEEPGPVATLSPAGAGTGPDRTAVNQLALSSDGRSIASAMRSRTTLVWGVSSGTRRLRLSGSPPHPGKPVFSPDGKTLAFAWKNRILIFDPVTGEMIREIRGHPAAPGGESPAGEEAPPTHTPSIGGVAFSPDGSRIASVGKMEARGDSIVHLWDAATGEEIGEIETEGHGLSTVSFSPDGSRIAAAGEWFLHVWDVASGNPLLKSQAREVSDVAFSPDGKTVGVASDLHRRIHLVDVATGKKTHLMMTHGARLDAIAFSPDGRSVASRDEDAKVIVWELASGRPLLASEPEVPFPGGPIIDGRPLHGASPPRACLAFSPDGKVLASSGSDDRLRLRNTADLEDRISLPCRPGETIEYCVFTPDGGTLRAIRGTREVVSIDRKTGERRVAISMKSLKEEIPWDSPRALSPDGSLFAARGRNRLLLAHVRTGEVQFIPHSREERTVASIAFSADGRMLFGFPYPSPQTPLAHAWEVATGREVLCLPAVDRFDVPTAWALSPDGRTLAAPTGGRTLGLLDYESGRWLCSFRLPGGRLQSIAFSPDGRLVATGNADGTILVWSVPVCPDEVATDSPVDLPDPEEAWRALVDLEGHGEIRRLAALGDRAVALLREQFSGPPAADADEIRRLVDRLDDPEFAAREEATRALEKTGHGGMLLLHDALKGDLSPEARHRIRQLLAKFDRFFVGDGGERLGRLRAIEVLERIGSTDARQVLRSIATDSPWGGEREQSEAALRRLGARRRSE